MAHVKRGWHNPAKENEPTTEGKCSECHKHVDNMESHIKDKHLIKKPKTK